jgi:hypothetical protein
MLLSVDAEQLKVGLEYIFMKRWSCVGLCLSDRLRRYPSGVGLQVELGGLDFGADYSYGSFGLFGNVHRPGVPIGL